MASTLIYGEKDAVLVDTFMTTRQANDLADWVESKGKNLTAIYFTHGHGDHWFGAGTFRARFPKARLVANPSTVEVMKVNASPQNIRARNRTAADHLDHNQYRRTEDKLE